MSTSLPPVIVVPAQVPILSPIAQLLHSRRFLILVAYLVIAVVVALVPDLAPIRNELLVGLAIVFGTAIGGYSLSDVADAARAKSALPPEDWRQALQDTLTEALGLAAVQPAQLTPVILPPTAIADGDVQKIVDALLARGAIVLAPPAVAPSAIAQALIAATKKPASAKAVDSPPTETPPA